MRQLCHTNFGISHSGGAIAINRAKITLTIDQYISHSKWLSHSYNRVIDGSVAMRVVLTNHITNNSSRFFVRFIIVIAKHIHGVQDPSMNRLQAIPNIRKRPSNNNTHRVLQIGVTHLIFYCNNWEFLLKNFVRIDIVRHRINLNK